MQRQGYTRLRGRSISLFGLGLVRVRLYAAADHLLVVRSELFGEIYRRFDYKDIQAMRCQGTSTRALATVALVALWAVGVLIVGSNFWIPGSGNVWLSFAGIVLLSVVVILIVWNALWGPTCMTRLYTAVWVEDLENLGRWRTANRVIDELRPRILQAQREIALASVPVEDAPPLVATHSHQRTAQSTWSEPGRYMPQPVAPPAEPSTQAATDKAEA